MIVDSDELGKILKVSVSTVRRLARRKDDPIPHVVVGSRMRFIVSEVLDWLRRQGE